MRGSETPVIALVLALAVAASAVTPAIASNQGVQESLIVKLYPDNSARLVGYVVVSGHPPVRGVAELNFTQLSNGSEALLYINMSAANVSKLVPKAGSSNGKQVEVEKLIESLKVRASGNGTLTYSKYVGKTILNFKIFIALGSDGNKLRFEIITLKPLRISRYVKNTTTTYEGALKVKYSGSNTAALALLFSMLNKEYIEAKLRQSNVTWVKIRELNTTTTPSSSVIRFSILINETAFIKALAKKNATVAAKFEKVVKTPLIPMKAKFSFTLSLGNGKAFAEVRAWSNLPLTKIIEATINNTLSSMKQLSIKGPTPATPQANPPKLKVRKALAIVANISKILRKFEILPSKGFIKVVVGKNGVMVTFQTLKFRAKGAKSAKNTLKELVSSVRELRSILGKHVSGGGGEGANSEAVKALDAVLKGNVSVVEVNSTAPPKTLPFEELGNYSPSPAVTATSTTNTASTASRTTHTTPKSTSATTVASNATVKPAGSAATATAGPKQTQATSKSSATTSSTMARRSTSTTSSPAPAKTTSQPTTSSTAPSTAAKARGASRGGIQIALAAGIAVAVAVAVSALATVMRRRRV